MSQRTFKVNRMRCLIVLSLLMLSGAFVRAEEDDDLAKARAAYEEVLSKQNEVIKTALERRLTDATQTGKLELVEEVHREIKDFQKRGKLPDASAMKGIVTKHIKTVSAARERLSSAYDRKVAALTKAGKIDEAIKTRDSLNAYLAGRVESDDLPAHHQPVIVAPKPQPNGFRGLHERLIAPIQGTELVVTQDSATLKVAAAVHDLSIELNQMTAPRVLEPVSGDFDYQVRVSNVNGPQGGSLQANRIAFVGAGILVWHDKQNYIRLERAALCKVGNPQLYANWEQRVSGAATRMGSTSDKRLTGAETWLRVRRRGNRIEGAVSEDGTIWFNLPVLLVDWPQDIQIGIAAVNNTPAGYEANFKERVLTVR